MKVFASLKGDPFLKEKNINSKSMGFQEIPTALMSMDFKISLILNCLMAIMIITYFF